MNKALKRRADLTASSANVFVDLGFESAEAAVMEMRAILAIRIEQRIRARRWNRAEAAKQLRITQTQLRGLLADTGGGVSLDLLVSLACRVGLRPQLKLGR